MGTYRPQYLGADSAPNITTVERLELMDIPQSYTTVVNRKTLANTRGWKNPMDDYKATNKLFDIYAIYDDTEYRVMNPLENCYVKEGKREAVFGSEWMYYELVVEKVPVPDPLSYFRALSNEVDPKNYLLYLMKHLQVGITLQYTLPWIKAYALAPDNDAEGFNWESPDGAGLYIPKDYPSRIKYKMNGDPGSGSAKDDGTVFLPVSRNTALAYPDICAIKLYEGKIASPAYTVYKIISSADDLSILLPYSVSHRAMYRQAVERFREVINFTVMDLTQRLLWTSNIDDLPTLKHGYNMFLNRYASFFNDSMSPTKKHVFTIKSGVDGSLRTIKTGLPTNDIEGPMIPFKSAISFPAFTGIDESATILPAESFPAECDCCSALRRILREEMTVLWANINKLEAQIAARSDTSASQSTTAYSRDYSQNPFLIWDARTETFKNLAVNVNVPVASEPVVLNPASGVTAAHFAQAPAIRSLYLRNVPTREGTTVSRQEILEAVGEGGITTGKLVPWIIGGLAAAAVVGGML